MKTSKDELENYNVKTYDGASRITHEESNTIEGSGTATLVNRTQTTVYDEDGRPIYQQAQKGGLNESVVYYGNNVSTHLMMLSDFRAYYELPPETPFTLRTLASVTLYNGDRWTDIAVANGLLGIYGADDELPPELDVILDHWTQGFDKGGVLRNFSVTVYDAGVQQHITEYMRDYRLGEGYQQTAEEAEKLQSGVHTSGKTSRTYNVNGELVQTSDEIDPENNRYFINNAQGQALAVVQGQFDGQSGRLTAAQAFENSLARTGNEVKAQYFFFANGQQVGSFGQLQDAGSDFTANFDVNFTPISSEYPASVPSDVTVQAGETLRTIAARVFGDANLWYLLADENGLTNPDEELTTGLQLRVPNQVISLSNSSTTFKPFNVSDAIGDTTPAQPAPPVHRKKGCGVVGQILTVVVAIVVTVYTAGALSGGAGALLATEGTAGSVGAAGVAALSGGLAGGVTAGTVGIAAVASAAGSLASQGVGIATGLQDELNWKGVAAAAISGGLAAGTPFGGVAGKNLGSQVLQGAMNSAVAQGANIVVGLQKSFSWESVAAAAISAPIGNQLAAKAGGITANTFNSAVIGRAVGTTVYGLTSQAVQGAFTGGKIDYAQIAADAFGNAFGNSIVDGIAGSQTRTAVAKLSKDQRAQYEDLKSQGYDPDKALALAQGRAVTFALDDPNAPKASPLRMEWVSGEPRNDNYILNGYSRPEIDFHAADKALLNGLRALNDKTQIPLLGEAKEYLDRKLEGLADFSFKNGESAMTPVYGGLYAAGKAGLGLFPTGLLDVAPELAAVGKLGRFGKTVDELMEFDSGLSRTSNLGRTDELIAGGARRILPTAEDFAAPFETLGLKVNPEAFPEGQRIIYELEKSGYSREVAVSRARGLIQSGSTLPVTTPIDRTEALYKLTPQGRRAPEGSAYWVTESEYRQLAQEPATIAEKLGLPLQSRADVYDVYKIRTIDSGAVVYQSVTAPTRQGNFLQQGGSRQTLVLDNSMFTPPALIGTVRGR